MVSRHTLYQNIEIVKNHWGISNLLNPNLYPPISPSVEVESWIMTNHHLWKMGRRGAYLTTWIPLLDYLVTEMNNTHSTQIFLFLFFYYNQPKQHPYSFIHETFTNIILNKIERDLTKLRQQPPPIELLSSESSSFIWNIYRFYFGDFPTIIHSQYKLRLIYL